MTVDDLPDAPAAKVRESLLHALVDQSPAFIAVRAIDGIYLYANDRFAHALGVTSDDIVGRRAECVAPDASVPLPLRLNGATDAREPAFSGIEEGELEGGPHRLLVTRFPLRAHGQIFAVGLIATDLDASLKTGEDLHASLERAEAANAELRRALERMERLAYTDRLTGAWNRRHLDDAAIVAMSRTERHGHPVSLLLVDIDHFKSLNDRFGHPVGDRVLIELVRCLRATLRRADSVTRWGGEEFVVLAPDSALQDAWQLADKLCARIAGSRLSEALAEPVTASIGVAEYQAGEGFEAWLSRADQALYEAKRQGRNRAVADTASAFGVCGERPLGASLVKLMWREAYNSGDPGIDRQHRALFERANRLLDIVLSGAPREAVLDAIHALVNEIATHFSDEERLHERIGYPDREAHAAEHSRLLTRALDLLEAAVAGPLTPAELFQYLAHDVIALHLLGADRRYFPYLEQQDGFGGATA